MINRNPSLPTHPIRFGKGDEGNLICRHRELSCCTRCADVYEQIVAVEGKHFWITDEAERAMLAGMGY